MAQLATAKLAKTFTRLGWIGFWMQVALATVPLFMLGYFLWGQATGNTIRLGFTDYLALIGLGVLGFTTLWSLRYAQLGKKLVTPNRQPSRTKLIGVLWTGLVASAIGVVLSLLLMLFEVVRLLFLFMKAPQGGVPVMRTEVDLRTDWVSAIDVVSLLAELCTLTGELVVMGFTLWLMYRVSQWTGPDAEPGPPAA